MNEKQKIENICKLITEEIEQARFAYNSTHSDVYLSYMRGLEYSIFLIQESTKQTNERR